LKIIPQTIDPTAATERHGAAKRPEIRPAGAPENNQFLARRE
jgi:hypothetical protein